MLRMTVWIKGVMEFWREVLDGVKGDSCLVLRMTGGGRNDGVYKGILEFLGEVMDGVKGDSCLERE